MYIEQVCELLGAQVQRTSERKFLHYVIRKSEFSTQYSPAFDSLEQLEDWCCSNLTAYQKYAEHGGKFNHWFPLE